MISPCASWQMTVILAVDPFGKDPIGGLVVFHALRTSKLPLRSLYAWPVNTGPVIATCTIAAGLLLPAGLVAVSENVAVVKFVSLLTTALVPLIECEPGPLIEYVGVPPFPFAALHFSCAPWSTAVPVNAVGADGAVHGRTATDGVEAFATPPP